jgi:uncharacterized zinc-type alcohol dehydrogenase-like protein
MTRTAGWAAFGPKPPFKPHTFERREPTPRDVEIDILFCGVCHSDLHTVKSEWEGTVYPCIPGHEILGRVSRAGSEVTRFAPGDLAAVGCMVDSCRTCPECRAGLEQYCRVGATLTYNSPDPHTGGYTFGGYSERIVVDHDFVLRVPKNLDPAGAAPLLCAGITTFSPLRRWGAGPGRTVGVVGLGGLGHMAVKIAHAMGARVVVFTGSKSKVEDAHRLGADEVTISKDASAMAARAGTLDLIIDTVSASHDLDAYLTLLARDGTLCLVGAPEHPHPSPTVGLLIGKRRSIAGSLIGGIPETQEMLDFCGTHGIVSDVEVIPIQKIDEAYERMLKSDVKYRFSIDLSSLRG